MHRSAGYYNRLRLNYDHVWICGPDTCYRVAICIATSKFASETYKSI